MDELMKTSQVAKELNISGSYLRDLIAKDVLTPSSKTNGGHWLWSVDDIKNADEIINGNVPVSELIAAKNLGLEDPPVAKMTTKQRAEFAAEAARLKAELTAEYKKVYRHLYINSFFFSLAATFAIYWLWAIIKVVAALLALIPHSGVGYLPSLSLGSLGVMAFALYIGYYLAMTIYSKRVVNDIETALDY
jgi:DNA-binding transcriptional MerR regulator